VPPRPGAGKTTARRRLIADATARWVVTAGGMAIIASILGILVFIIIEVLPLLAGAEIEAERPLSIAGHRPRAVIADEHRTHAALLDADGHLRVVRLDDGSLQYDRAIGKAPDPAEGDLEGAPRIDRVEPVPGRQLLAASNTAGNVLAVPVDWRVSFEGQTRQVEPVIGEPLVFELDPGQRPLGAFAVNVDDEGAGLAAAYTAAGDLALMRRDVEQNLFTGDVSATYASGRADCPLPPTRLLADQAGRNLYGGAATGELLWWRVRGAEAEPPQVLAGGAAPVTALTLLIGDRSLVVGRADGSLEIWFPVRQSDESFRLTRIREFPPLSGAVELLAPSMRDKGFLAQDAAGRLGLYHSTSQRTLSLDASPLPGATSLFFTPKADGALLAGDGRLVELALDNPHPDVSLRSLFSHVWYEGYDAPRYVWQSTGGTDDFEPKLSLVPLMVGTLKGTVYSLFLAIPLGVLGAMYTSQFLHPGLKRYIKPTVEIMAALPSVVLGFLAGLWLAPRVQALFPALVLVLLLLPPAIVAAGVAWAGLPRRLRGALPAGTETLLFALVALVVIGGSLAAVPWIESAIFGGDFQSWLLRTTGLPYDQRNAIVVGLAMGFAVIPIIFSIAEDAFSNVPRHLVSGSLALGATRWQTVTRVVLPTASAGIFSAIMIGFGRAVGETMIVLMATGNTPLLDWNPFNGFRTLSANIAVEIPEAPHGGTLYRTLFLAALILFAFTFLINTIAELVRQRLRQRYSQM